MTDETGKKLTCEQQGNFHLTIMSRKKQYNSKDIFDCAFEFDYAGHLLLHKFGQNEIHAINPIIVNSAFALELYFKCLYHLHTGKSAPHTHELKKLFDILPEECRNKIEWYFSCYIHVQRGRKAYIESRSRNHRGKYKSRFETWNYQIGRILDIANCAFNENRYAYELYTKIQYGLGTLTDAVRDCILELKPEWKKEKDPLRLIYQISNSN